MTCDMCDRQLAEMATVHVIAILLALNLLRHEVICYSQNSLDSRCFLESGGSAEHFFVSEDTPVGSVIGTLRIIGDPSENGNITLGLANTKPPVAIVPATKNIMLTSLLDKEGKLGPSSVNFNVICDRMNATDPSFVIPVTVRVMDVNDNAPQFLDAPYILNISEVTIVGTRVLRSMKVVDIDQHGPSSTVQFSVLPGPYSDYFTFENELEGTLVLQKSIDYEKLTNFSITIRAQDQGSPVRHSDTEVKVNVMDADDQNPRFFDERYTALLPNPALAKAQLQVWPREVAAYDPDKGIGAPVLYTLDPGGTDGLFEIDGVSGSVRLGRAVNAAELRSPIMLMLRATQVDNPDRYAVATLTVESVPTEASGSAGEARSTAEVTMLFTTQVSTTASTLHSSPPLFLQRVFSTRTLESLPSGSRLLTLLTNRPLDKVAEESKGSRRLSARCRRRPRARSLPGPSASVQQEQPSVPVQQRRRAHHSAFRGSIRNH